MNEWLAAVFSHPKTANDALIIAGKTTVVYLFLVLGLRLLGKRELGQMNIYDLVLIIVLANAVQLGADYEFLRNVVFSATGAYEVDRFFGMIRKDDVVITDERVKYKLSRYGSIAVYRTYTNRNSDVPIFSYDKHQVGINVTAQF